MANNREATFNCQSSFPSISVPKFCALQYYFKMLIIIVLILYIPQRAEVSDTYVCQICLFC